VRQQEVLEYQANADFLKGSLSHEVDGIIKNCSFLLIYGLINALVGAR